MKKMLCVCAAACALSACVQSRPQEEYVTAYQYMPYSAPYAVPYTYEVPACPTCEAPRYTTYSTCSQCAKPQPKPQTVMIVAQVEQPAPEVVYPQPQAQTCGCKSCGCKKSCHQ